jgi:hypothetical protein
VIRTFSGLWAARRGLAIRPEKTIDQAELSYPMPLEIYSYKDWMTDTRGAMTTIRSRELKDLDEAIKIYEQNKDKPNYNAVKARLATWKMVNGGSAKLNGELLWKSNLHNARGAIAKLDERLWQEYPALDSMVETSMADARLGVVYFLSQIKPEASYGKLAKEIKKSFGEGSNTGGGGDGSGGGSDVAPAQNSRVESVWNTITDHVREDFNGEGIEDAISAAVENVLPEIRKQIAGVLDECKEIGAGVAKAIKNFRRVARLEELVKGVTVLPGHPSLMAARVTKLVEDSAWDGVKDAVKSAVQTSITAVSGGMSKIVTAVGGAIYAVYKFVKRYLEIRAINKIIGEAADYWAEKTIQHDPEKFNGWFARITEKVPILAALTLNAGICGSLASFIQLYPLTDGGPGVGANAESLQSQSSGSAYQGKLKRCASRLIREYEVKFSSSEKMVATCLAHGAEGDLIHEEANSGMKAWLWKMAQANALAAKVVKKVMKTSTAIPGSKAALSPTGRSRSGAVAQETGRQRGTTVYGA